MKVESRFHRFDFQPGRKSTFQVDPLNGIIRDVAVITMGEARGHNLEVDGTTLSQLKECADGMETVAVKWNHKSGADEVAGFLKNFRVEGKKLLGDLHLLKAHSRYDQAIEMAERMPNNFGLSAAFMGADEKVSGRSFARCSELISVDLVASPACNPSGMFARRFFADIRPRNQQGEFASASSAGSDPNDMAAAYNPGVIQKRQGVQQGASGSIPLAGAASGVIEKFRLRAALARQQVDPEAVEFARGDSEPSKLRTVAGAAAGAALGGLAGLRAGQMKFRPMRAGEKLSPGRLVGVHKSITVAGVPTVPVLHVGVVDDRGRIIHSSPQTGVRTHTRAAFTEGKSLYVEHSGATVSGEDIRQAAKRAKGEPWTLTGANCEHTAAKLVGRSPSSPQLRAGSIGAVGGGVIGAGVASRKKSGRREFSSAFRFVRFDSRTKQSPFDGEVKAGLSGALSGAALGSIAALRRGTSIGQIAKSVGLGAAAGGALVGGGSAIGSALIGAPQPGEGAPYTKRAAIGGALAGGVLGAGAGALALKTKLGSAKIAQWAKDWRPAVWAQNAGPLGAAGIGAIGGAVVGGGHAADEGQQVDTLNALKQQRQQNMNKQFDRPESLAKTRYRKQIKEQDATTRDANILRAGLIGAGAGALARGKVRLPVRAAIGAGAGTAGVLGIRTVTSRTKDSYGDRSRAAKQVEKIAPMAGGLGAAALLAKKRVTGRFFDRSDEMAVKRLAAQYLTKPGGGIVPLSLAEVSRRCLLSRESVNQAMQRGEIRAVRPHERLKGWHYFEAAALDALRNRSVMRIARASYKALSRRSASVRMFERAVRDGVLHAEQSAGSGQLHEFAWNDDQDSDPVTTTAKRIGTAIAGAGVIGGGVLAGNAIRNRIGTMGATVPGFTQKPAWGQIGAATSSVAGDALGSAASGIKSGLDDAGDALGTWGVSDGLAAKLGKILKRGAGMI